MGFRNKKKHKRGTKNESEIRDRLSELPDEILVHILSFLPMKDAIKTVQLRRFGKLWTMSRTLEFGWDTECSFIYNVIRFHEKPTIDAFELDSVRGLSHKYLLAFTNFALGKKTNTLRVKLTWDRHEFVTPPQIFQSECLVTLELDGLKIKLPRVVDMGSLRTLELSSAVLCDNTFQAMINGCPRLQELYLRNPSGLERVHFTSPTIETLKLDLVRVPKDGPYYSLDCPNVKRLRIERVRLDCLDVIDVSSVEVAIIRKDSEHNMVLNSHHFEVLLNRFQKADFFRQGRKACIKLKECGHPFIEELDGFSTDWTHIVLRPGSLGSCLRGAYRLLGSSSMLEKVIIYANEDYICDCNERLLQEVSNLALYELKNVSIREYEKPCKALLQLIEFLLKKAVTLEKVVIACKRKDRFLSMEAQQFILTLLSLPRTSRNASIVFA